MFEKPSLSAPAYRFITAPLGLVYVLDGIIAVNIGMLEYEA